MDPDSTEVEEQSKDVELQGETAEQEREQVEPVESPEKDDSFEQGFNTVKGIESPEPEPEPLFAGYTKAQLDELFEKSKEVDKLRERESKVFGTLGSLKQSIEAIRSQPAATPAARLNLEGKLSRLEAEFPEMASILREDLAEAFESAGQTSQSVDVEKVIGDRLAERERAMEIRLVGMRHKDWREVVKTPEFEQWKGTLAPDELENLGNSWNAEEIADGLDKFKSWRDASVEKRQSRQQKLQAAITPKGGRQATTSTETDAFLAGFRAVRGGQPT